MNKKKVIEELTFENMRRYVTTSSSSAQQSRLNVEFHFVHGDWSRIMAAEQDRLIPSAYFDIILTTETIYNKAYHRSLLQLLHSRLRPESSSYVLLGAKTYYFGCTGHLDEFMRAARAPPYSFRVSADGNLLVALDGGSKSTARTDDAGDDDASKTILAKEIIKLHLI